LEFEGGVISRFSNRKTRRANAEGDYAMEHGIIQGRVDPTDGTVFDSWFDPIEAVLRTKVRGFIKRLIEEELSSVLDRPRYGRPSNSSKADGAAVGHRHGHRNRSLTGTFGPTEIAVPRARLVGEAGKTTEWKSQSLRAYQRRTRAADALIASTYLSGTNTRRVRRALAAVFTAKMWSAASGGR
jgi:putative transposase